MTCGVRQHCTQTTPSPSPGTQAVCANTKTSLAPPCGSLPSSPPFQTPVFSQFLKEKKGKSEMISQTLNKSFIFLPDVK